MTKEIMEKERIVLKELLDWKNDFECCFDGGVWWGYDMLSDATDIPVKELKKIMKKLREEKKVSFVPTINQDGMISGSGYFLTDAFQKQLESEQKKEN